MTYYYESELYHHGIKGQKWGDRNGPPYPLDYKHHSLAEKKSNPASRIDGNPNTKSDDIRRQEEEQKKARRKKAIIIGAAAAGTALAVYGGYKFYQAYNDKGEIDPSTGFRKLATARSTQDIANNVNPGLIRVFSKGKNLPIMDGSTTNCAACSTAMELQKRGFDVRAKRGSDILLKDVENLFKGNRHFENTPIETCEKELLKHGNGARGQAALMWSLTSGHDIFWEVSDNKVRFFDGQTGVEYKDFAKKMAPNIKDLLTMRTDDLDLNLNTVKKYVTNDTQFQSVVKYGKNSALPYLMIDAAAATTGIAIASNRRKKRNESHRSNQNYRATVRR